jgi:hypothetical protein
MPVCCFPTIRLRFPENGGASCAVPTSGILPEVAVLRLELEAPAKEKLTIQDLLIAGNKVLFPGQVAELLSIHLFVTRWKRGDASVGPEVKCDATCCRNGVQLELSDGSCSDGFQLAYPDLLPPKVAVAMASTPPVAKMISAVLPRSAVR